MPSIWAHDVNCVTSFPTSPHICLFSSGDSHGNRSQHYRWASSGQNWGIPGESRIRCLPTAQMVAATQARLGGLLPFCFVFLFLKQCIQLWRDDFKDGRRLSATGSLSGSCAVMSLPRFHHYLLRDVGASLPALTCSNTKTLSSGSSTAEKPY